MSRFQRCVVNGLTPPLRDGASLVSRLWRWISAGVKKQVRISRSCVTLRPMANRAHRKFLKDVQDRQRNTIWPDTVRNGSKADGAIWFGADNPTKIQRIGFGLFGAVFFSVGVISIASMWQSGNMGKARLSFVMGAVLLVIGGRILWNAFRPAKKSIS